MRIKCFLFFLLSLSIVCSYAQKSKADYEKEQREIKQKLKETEKILSSTEKARKTSLAQLRALSHQITERKRYIRSLRNEIRFIDGEIAESNDIIQAIQNDLDTLKIEYARMIYEASKTNTSFEKLAFIFSSETYNELLMRIRYISMYNEHREKQLVIIEAVKQSLIDEHEELLSKKKEKQEVLDKIIEEEVKLEGEKRVKSDLITDLSSRQKELKKKLKEFKKQQEKIDEIIRKFIVEPKSPGMYRMPKVERDKLSKKFTDNRGRLPWPLSEGIITRRFGTHPHPVFGDKVMINNKGIGVQTEPMHKITSVFDGEVRMVVNIPGMNQVVMISHGEYITVYSKLKTVYVSRGEIVKAKDVIGVVDTNVEGETELDFQVWKGREPVNPEAWLARK